MTPREAGGSENPGLPDPRERGVPGACSAPRLRSPGIPGKSRTESRAPADPGGRAPKQPEDHRAHARGRGTSVCVGGEGGGGVTESPPPPAASLPKKIRALLCVVLSELRAAQSHHSSWGQGSGAHCGDARADGESRRAFSDRTSKPRTALSAHLVSLARRGTGSVTLVGPNLKGLPGRMPRRALLRHRSG